MNGHLNTLSLMIMVSLNIGIAHAAHDHHEKKLDTVTVTGTSIPSVVSAHLDEQDIAQKRSHTSDTAALLESLPGVTTYTAGGVSRLPVIRGFADDRLRIKVDGMDLISACANHMNPPLSYMNPSRVADIQVYSGIVPVSVGGDSIGGAIIAKSKAPAFAESGEVLTTGELGGFYRSNGDARGVNLTTTVATEQFSFRYTGSKARANNYDAGGNFKAAGPAASDRGYLAADEVGSTAYETRNHALDFAYQLENHLFQMKFGYQDIPYQAWPNQRMDMLENRSRNWNFIYNGEFDWGNLEASVYHEVTNHRMQFGNDKQFMYGVAYGMPMETKARNTGISVQADIPLSSRDLLRVGTNIQKYRLDDFWEASGGMMMAPNTFWNINNGERDRYGIFAEWEANWNTQWSTLMGIRHETIKMDSDNVQGYNMMYQGAANSFNNANRDLTDHNVDLTVLARYAPADTHDYEFGYSRKTRSPNLYERFAWSTHPMAMRMVNLVGDGNGYVGNVDLDPETAHTLSATANFHDAEQHNWHLSVTPYVSYVNNFIDAEHCQLAGCSPSLNNEFVYLQYDNVSAKLYGIDFSGYRKLYSSSRFGDFSGYATLSYLRGKNRDTGDNLYNIMPLNSTLTLEHQKNGWTNQIEWLLVASKDKVNDARNEMTTSGYGLINLRTSYEWQQARVDFGIENVFDRFYSHPLSGAYVGQGATMGAGVWGTTVPAMGRSIYAGLTVKF